MIYKIYNESPEVGTAAKTLKSVIFCNVCNMCNMMEAPGRAQMAHGRNTPSVPAWRHQDDKKRAANKLQPVG